ncbi:uncharacterized protein LOC133927117 [Phragmites australis]|uniref:uncharacterized protein LOC133927117 n=1 Tax=Phragmites australis TaxID=29695 RepID=UPI002D769CFB|nr:uncharacterized protein LOC133927117 [Phragmites australis]
MTAVDTEACAVVATAADIICSLRAADIAGWTPPWRKHPPPPPPACDGADADGRELAWPAVARGKRSRRGSPSASGSASASASAAAKERCARGSPASPLDYSGGSGASTSGGEDGAFCSTAPATVYRHAAPANAAPSMVGLAGRRSILPVPPPRPAGQRPRKKMRLPEIQQMVQSLSVENDALREEMKALQRACTALSKENGKLETRIDQSSMRHGIVSEKNKGKPQPDQRAAEQEARNGFALPDLNLPAHDNTDGSAH